MTLTLLPVPFTVCQVGSISPAFLKEDFCFIGKTADELSLVCDTALVPADASNREDGWRCFRLEGVFEFTLVGVLAPILDILAKAKVGIFAVSTYNTDYVLIKEENLTAAIAALSAADYDIKGAES